VDEADLVGIHEARVAHHVQAIGEVDGQYGTAAVLHGGGAVVVELLVVVGEDVAAGKHIFEVRENSGSIDMTFFEVAVLGQSFTMRILPSRSRSALISPTFSLSRISWGSSPSRIC